MTTASILWRRLDTPGHDACRLMRSAAKWELDGTAVFRQDGVAARLSYRITCDSSWRTEKGSVQGWLGLHSVKFSIARTNSGGWTLNDATVTGLEECVDLDLGFTPATNLVHLRRLALAVDQQAAAPAAWLDVSAGILDGLYQRYERRTETAYWYEAPRFDYQALLEVNPDGFIEHYPRLWEAEP